jgi:hypothetical protein
MLRAAELAGQNEFLRSIALESAADLLVHAGRLKEAASLYGRSFYLNGADFHSLLGLGWIAMVHDGNDELAARIFEFVNKECKLPDPFFKLMQLAEWEGNVRLQRKYSQAFVQSASDPRYGKMYSKYLIQIYSGILHEEGLAEKIARVELVNRPTPQTYAWYAWTLLRNHKKDEALRIFHRYISGRQLEGLELFWMGKLMEENQEGYNAIQFFSAARSNQYDLDPLVKKELEKKLDQ